HLAYGAENTIVVVYSVKDNGDGIGEYVRLRACDVFAGTEWQAREQLDGEIAGWYAKEIISTDGWTETGSIAGLPRAPGHMFWVRNAVQVDTPADLWVPRYLELQGILGKCNVWWNGNFLGRYWDIGPQMKFYIPEPIIEMENQVTLLFLPCDGEAALEIPPAVKPFDIVRKSKWIIPIP
ncbi:MAG TPA: beta galactosidase jelly roll domain-containing protein, partial [Candidatus Lokiarchaeia archaeon]|nr:beta galactosidase jelly roll domain-containing protein [Candidatus Lokiarchaeia archaeon]